MSFIVQIFRICQSLSPTQAPRLVNNVIDKTLVTRRYTGLENEIWCMEVDGLVGAGYCRKFMRRHKHLLVSKRGGNLIWMFDLVSLPKL